MKTSVILSNITWNTPQFFKRAAEELVKAGILDWVHAVPHKAESDEKKEHIHFILKPSKAIDTAWLQMRFTEIPPGEFLPRKPTSDWRKTKNFTDWLLYSLHDKDYLASKLEKHEFSYTLDDCITTDISSLENSYREAKLSGLGPVSKIRRAYELGYKREEFFLSGAIPLSLIGAANTLWDMLESRESCQRNGHDGHE